MEQKIIEPLLTEDDNRFVMFPISDNDVWNMYKKAEDCFWRVEEVDLSKDYKDWVTLSDNEQHFISMILAFFAASDGIVLENLGLRFMSEVQLAEAKAFYGFQIAMENIHSIMYSQLIETYIKDSIEKNKLFNALNNYQCIRKKGDWALKWIKDKDSSFATRLVAFACVEGIFFSGAFCSIYWIKKRGLLPGLTFSNELISRDEALHTEFAILLYSKLENKLMLEINKRKEILKDEYKILQERKRENNFLEQVYDDYKNYYSLIIEEKQKQYEALQNISNYLDSIIQESNIAKDKLEELKNDKYKILGKIEQVRSEINDSTLQ